MALIERVPRGGIRVLAPVTWGSDGFPAVTASSGKWGTPYSDLDYFTSIDPQWEWNRKPNTSKHFTGDSGLVLNTPTDTYDLYTARNSITHRILGRIPTMTIKFNYANMKDGNRAGPETLCGSSAWVGKAVHSLSARPAVSP